MHIPSRAFVILGLVVVFSAGLAANFFLAHRQSEPLAVPPANQTQTSTEAPVPIGSTQTLDIKLPPYDLTKLFAATTTRCKQDAAACFKNRLNEITRSSGPEAALEVLASLQQAHLIQTTIDDHQLAHAIGRRTAERFGVSGASFLLCPTSFNYGCQHGFFEYALGRANSTKEVINQICGAFETNSSYSAKFKFYCYHGVGHGVLMAQAYDLDGAIRVCDSLDSETATDGCWQGVFMENVNAGMRGEARTGVFSKTDALAPCDKVGVEYRHECFINHAGWLMQFFRNDVREAATACLAAPAGSLEPCLQSIGLMATNPVWQSALAGTNTGMSVEETAWSICLKFPASHRDQCVIGSVDNLLNFDELKVTRSASFCLLVDQGLQALCYREIGINLANETTNALVIRNLCGALAPSARDSCLAGARIQ